MNNLERVLELDSETAGKLIGDYSGSKVIDVRKDISMTIEYFKNFIKRWSNTLTEDDINTLNGVIDIGERWLVSTDELLDVVEKL